MTTCPGTATTCSNRKQSFAHAFLGRPRSDGMQSRTERLQNSTTSSRMNTGSSSGDGTWEDGGT